MSLAGPGVSSQSFLDTSHEWIELRQSHTLAGTWVPEGLHVAELSIDNVGM